MPKVYAKSTVILSLLYSLATSVHADDTSARSPRSVDVFTTKEQLLESVEAFLDDHPETTVRVYLIDAIERLEDELSRGLSAQPEQAKREALQRLQRLSKDKRARLEQTGKALALAMQLRVTRYPAVVFDQEQVVYGVTDLSRAMEFYRSRPMKDEF